MNVFHVPTTFFALCLLTSLRLAAFGVNWTSSLTVNSTIAYIGQQIVVTSMISDIEAFEDTPENEYPVGNQGNLEYRWFIDGMLQNETSSCITLQNGSNGITGPGHFVVLCEAKLSFDGKTSAWIQVGTTTVTFFKLTFLAPNEQPITSFDIIAGHSVQLQTVLTPNGVNADITYETSDETFSVVSSGTSGTLTINAPNENEKTANIIAHFNGNPVDCLAVKAVEAKVEIRIVP